MSTVRIEAMNKCLAEISQGVSVKAIGLLTLDTTGWCAPSTARSGPLRTSSATCRVPVGTGPWFRSSGHAVSGQTMGSEALPPLPSPCKKPPLQDLGYGRVNDVSKMRQAGRFEF
jgi:hypothetical protein